jgi:ATP-binding cassette subfamily B protein/subfamily B ATP-binding cassette protein MsbA
MRNPLRAIRLALRYPLSMAATVGLTFLVAALWGGNIAAVYPILEVAFQGRSLQDWSAQQIADSQAAIAELNKSLEALRQQPQEQPAERARRQFEMDRLTSRLAAERTALRFMQRLHPSIVRYLPRDPFQTVALLVAIIIAATAVKNAGIVAQHICTSRIARGVATDLRREYFERVLQSDMRQFAKRGTSRLWTRFVEDIPHLSHGLTAVFGRAIGEPLKIMACLIGAGLISWRLLLASLLLAPPAAILIGTLARRLRRDSLRAYDRDVQLNQLVFEALQGLPTIQAFTMEPAERQRLRAAASRSSQHAARVAWLQALTKPTVEILGIGAIAIALVAGAYLVLNQETHLLGIKISDRPLGLSAILIFYAMLLGATEPLRKLADVIPTLQLSLAAADRLFAVIDEPPSIADPPHPRAVARPHGELALVNVSFHYTAKRPVLRELNLRVPFGEVIAIVGPNGCGKSTLAHLVPRFFDPVAGSVRLDGIDLREVAILDLRRRIGLVSQHAHLFDGTVLENIRYGAPDAPEEAVFDAARKAFADEFIRTHLAYGYQTRVGQGGSALSGGQRQRIALARAILRDPEILILDEPTSQIDLVSERLIHKSLESFVRNRTAIVITHRLSLLALANRILVMQRGKVVADGTCDHLLATSPMFRELWDLQAKKAA